MDNRDSALGTQVATMYEIIFWLLICALSLLLVASPGWSFEWTPQTVPALTTTGTDGAEGAIVLVAEGKRDSRGGGQGSPGGAGPGSGRGSTGGTGQGSPGGMGPGSGQGSTGQSGSAGPSLGGHSGSGTGSTGMGSAGSGPGGAGGAGGGTGSR